MFRPSIVVVPLNAPLPFKVFSREARRDTPRAPHAARREVHLDLEAPQKIALVDTVANENERLDAVGVNERPRVHHKLGGELRERLGLLTDRRREDVHLRRGRLRWECGSGEVDARCVTRGRWTVVARDMGLTRAGST